MGKVMIVTGAARGIGRAVAMMAADRGWDLAINWHSDDAAGHEVLEAVRAKGRRAIGLRGDVAREDDVIALFDAAARDLGGIDSVIVNAGILPRPCPWPR